MNMRSLTKFGLGSIFGQSGFAVGRVSEYTPFKQLLKFQHFIHGLTSDAVHA